MKYYIVSLKAEIENSVQLVNWYKELPIDKCKWGTYHEVPDKTLLNVKESKWLYFPEVLFFPCFMVSLKCKKILEDYEPNMGYREVILLERVTAQTCQYYLPHLQQVKCLHEDAELSINKEKIITPVFDRDRLPDLAVFECEETSKRTVVMRQDFLESLLRRGAYLEFREVELRGATETNG